MPQVPYNPVPRVSPTTQGTPSVSINTPGAAFGSAVAEAIKGLGNVTEQAGNELFNRAIAMQNLRNETEAREADAQYMIKAGELHAQYSSLQGNAAVQGYPKYTQDLQDLRVSIRNSLSNPMAQKMYDSSSLSTMGRTVFNGAGHAATQGKIAAANASKARVDAMKDQALSMPGDDVAFQKSLNDVEHEVGTQADIGGWGEDQTNNAIFKDKSELWARRIEGLARTNPFKAKEMLEENRQKLHYVDVDRADKIVSAQLHLTGARNISDVTNQGWASYMKPNEMDRAAGVQEPLTRIVKEAQRAHPEMQFTVGQGKEPSTDGRAIDLVPTMHGQAIAGDYDAIDLAMKEASERLGIPLQEPKADGHFALPNDYDVRTAPKRVEEPLQSRIDRGVAFAREFAPDDTAFHEATRDRIESDFSRSQAIKRNNDYTNRNTIEGALVGGVGGKIPTTREELIALGPQVQAAWENLDEINQRKYLKALAENSKGDHAWSVDSLRRYQTLKGMAQSDPAEFLGVDVIGEKFPNHTKLELINLQQRMKGNAQGDPRVSQAMLALRPQLDAAGISRATDKDGYDNFVGSLQDQLEAFQDAHKRRPNMKETQEMGAKLLQQQISGRFLGMWNTHSPMFSLPVPAEEAEKIKASPSWKALGREPTDDDVRRIWIQKKYKELYGSGSGPQVPKSQ